jgi:Peptidase MA superfamily
MLRRVLLAIVVALGLANGSGAFTASAASGGISILQQDAASAFPTQLNFHVAAQSNAQITSLRLAFRISDNPVTTVAAVQFPPGFRVDTTYHLDLQRNYLPPGVTVHYWWQIEDQTNAHLDTLPADLPVVDPRFGWHVRSNPDVNLHWYDGTTDFADAVMTGASKAMQTARLSAVPPAHPAELWLYGNQTDFRSALGAGSPQWSGGQTYPAFRVVLLLAPSTDPAGVQKSVAHEMTHVAVDDPSQSGLGQPPAWLDEGLAMVAEGQLDPPIQQSLDAAVKAQILMSIQSISGNFPESTEGATLAYAESDSLVTYLLRTYGRPRIDRLIGDFRQGETADEAFQDAFGNSVQNVQQAWQKSLSPAAAPTARPATAATSPLQRLISAPIQAFGSLVRGILGLFSHPKAAPAVAPS